MDIHMSQINYLYFRFDHFLIPDFELPERKAPGFERSVCNGNAVGIDYQQLRIQAAQGKLFIFSEEFVIKDKRKRTS